ncbi:MAG: DUF3179 domain-containing protein [Vicinamibacteria bacterium]|nr:DUF3179 domain-containing protein [Vicinamibacteria bacterium]
MPTPRTHGPTPLRPFALWALFVLTVIAGVAIIAFPTLYIMPFKTQDTRLLGWALMARTAAPTVTLLAAVVAAILAVLTILRTRRWWLRAGALLLLAPVVLGAWFARQNHFEWMFAPQTTIAHVDAAKATFVEPDDLVMAVARQGAAIAYPIRQLAYHHIANDTLAGHPIVATY